MDNFGSKNNSTYPTSVTSFDEGYATRTNLKQLELNIKQIKHALNALDRGKHNTSNKSIKEYAFTLDTSKINDEVSQLEHSLDILKKTHDIEAQNIIINKLQTSSKEVATKAWELLQKSIAFVHNNVEVGQKLGAGGCGTVYKVTTDIFGQAVDMVRKIFLGAKDDHYELYLNWIIRDYISQNIAAIASDPFLYECVNKIPLLFPSEAQNEILSQAQSPKELLELAQKASEHKDGIFLEIKGTQNLDDLVNSENNTLSFDHKMKLFLDMLMGGAILDRANIIQRDFNCENIQLDLPSNGENPSAYLIDFGKAIYTKILHLFDNNDSERRDYCGPFYYSAPPEAYKGGFDNVDPDNPQDREIVFGQKYNAYNIGLLMFPLFFGGPGQEIMYNLSDYSDDGVVQNRKNLFRNLDTTIDNLNNKRSNPYTDTQIGTIKGLMHKLLNPDPYQRPSAEIMGRELYQKRQSA